MAFWKVQYKKEHGKKGEFCIFHTLLNRINKNHDQSPSIYLGTRCSMLRTQRHAARFEEKGKRRGERG